MRPDRQELIDRGILHAQTERERHMQREAVGARLTRFASLIISPLSPPPPHLLLLFLFFLLSFIIVLFLEGANLIIDDREQGWLITPV